MTAGSAPTRIAVVGAGGWGAQHARVFGSRDDVELCGIVARHQTSADHRAHEWGTRGYSDIASMLAAERPDLVSVCLPNERHFGPTMEVIEAGVPLFVEKPLAFSLDECDRLISAAAERDLFFAINFNHRYAEPVQRAKRAIDGGELGAIRFASWRFGGEGQHTGHPYANLIETQCHGLDLLEFLCGPIESVAAQMSDPSPGVYTTLAVAVRFSSGAVGSLIGSYDSSYSYPGTQAIEVNGDRGRLVIDDTVRRLSISRAGDETASVWEAGYFNDADRSFERTFDRHVDAMLAAFRRGDEPPVPAGAGRRAQSLAEHIIESFETGRRIPCGAAPKGGNS